MRAYVTQMTQRLFLPDRSPSLAWRTPPRQYAVTTGGVCPLWRPSSVPGSGPGRGANEFKHLGHDRGGLLRLWQGSAAEESGGP